MRKDDGDGRRKLGQDGEQAAVRYLVSRGYRVLARNWRCKQGELDTVMTDGEQLVFVEVRTRATPRFGSGAESVDMRKQQKLRQLALLFMRERQMLQDISVRFDVVSLQRLADGTFEITHIRHAF